VDSPPSEWDEGPGLVESVRRYKWLVAFTALLGLLAAYGWSSLQPVRYEGVVRVFLDDQGDQPADPGRIVRSQAEFLTSPAVMDRAVALSGGRLTHKELMERLNVEPARDADVITIRVLDATPRGAASLADTVARAYRQVLATQAKAGATRAAADLERMEGRLARELDVLTAQRQQRPDDPALQARADAKRQQLQAIASQKEQVAVDAARAARTGTLQEKAVIPDKPAQPKPLRTGAIGAVLGLLIGSALAWWLAGRRPAAAGRELAVPALGGSGRGPGGPRPRLEATRRHLRRVHQAPNGSEAADASQVGIIDFDRLTSSIERVFDSLEGERWQLYERNIPQFAADEIAARFPVDFVVVLLEDGAGLRPTGVVGLGTDPMQTAGHHGGSMVGRMLDDGPRLLSQHERTQLASVGITGRETETLVLVPLVRDGVAFGGILAGQWGGNGQAPALNGGHVEDIAVCAQQLAPHLRAWLLLRHLKLRLGRLDAPPIPS
jgi:hypothetical protein